MTTQNDFDVSGNLSTHSFAELLTEITVAKLSGAFRVAKGDQKLIVYFDNGDVIFAVSNARKYRLFDILLRENRIEKDLLGKIPNFANDMEFAAALKEKGMFTDTQIREIFVNQVRGILTEALSWSEGEWTFSPLARLRGGIRTEAKAGQLLAEYARSLSHEAISFRFKSLHEMFELDPAAKADTALEPDEAFVLSRLTATPQTIVDIATVSTLSENTVLKILYTLWFAGMLVRKEWNPAFSDFRIAKIRNANLTLSKPATDLQKPKAEEPAAPSPTIATQPEPQPEVKEVSLDEYLARTEKSESHYHILGIGPDAQLPEVRASYFTLAKLFHPDRFHRAEAEVLTRVENAFSKLAQA
ncbi:MAG: DUF4388 domain-containing protein, partial [Pyrinomonadaceae bacterium]